MGERLLPPLILVAAHVFRIFVSPVMPRTIHSAALKMGEEWIRNATLLPRLDENRVAAHQASGHQSGRPIVAMIGDASRSVAPLGRGHRNESARAVTGPIAPSKIAASMVRGAFPLAYSVVTICTRSKKLHEV